MISKKTILQKNVLLILLLLFSTSLFAQTDNHAHQKAQEPVRIKKHDLFEHILEWEPSLFGDFFFFKTPRLFLKNELRNTIQVSNENHFKTFSFSQNKFESNLQGLGSIEHFYNQVRWDAANKIKVDLRAGLAIQNTIMNPDIPNYQASLFASIEYSFNDRMSSYLYGQYLTNPVNKPDNYFDPFMHNNSLFLQNEIGSGLKANFKKAHLDFQIYSIYGTEPGNTNPVGSRIRIGF
nr:hypothetical protein [Sunxiuqinia sp.]